MTRRIPGSKREVAESCSFCRVGQKDRQGARMLCFLVTLQCEGLCAMKA